MNNHLSAIPNAFYDLMVFVTPSALLSIGLLIGFEGFAWVDLVKSIDVGDIGNLIFFAAIGLLVSYEFGRIAETWSAVLVQRPIAFIGRHTRFFSHPDYLRGHVGVYELLGLPSSGDGRDGDKWVIYLFGFVASPPLGADLLKRYAWEKLARSSALGYLILFLISVIYAILNFAGVIDLPSGKFGFGGVVYSSIVLLLLLLTSIEYYKRNVWNYDILVRTTPVLREAHRLQLLQVCHDMKINLVSDNETG